MKAFQRHVMAISLAIILQFGVHQQLKSHHILSEYSFQFFHGKNIKIAQWKKKTVFIMPVIML